MGGNDSCTQGMSELFPGDLFGLAEGRPDRFTRNRHSPRSNQFLDAERLEQINDGLELLWITRHLDGVGRGRRVNHVGPENVCDPERLGSVFCLGTGSGFSVRDVIAQSARVTNRDVPVIFGARRAGDAVSLVCVDERKLLSDIERLIKRDLPSKVVAGFEPDPPVN